MKETLAAFNTFDAVNIIETPLPLFETKKEKRELTPLQKQDGNLLFNLFFGPSEKEKEVEVREHYALHTPYGLVVDSFTMKEIKVQIQSEKPHIRPNFGALIHNSGEIIANFSTP